MASTGVQPPPTALSAYRHAVQARRPVVVVFYRGERSRFCRAWLKRWLAIPALDDRLAIADASILFVSAQSQGKAYSVAAGFRLEAGVDRQRILFLGDPTHDLARHLSERGLVHPIVTNPDGHRAHAWVYDYGMVQPAVLAVAGPTLYERSALEDRPGRAAAVSAVDAAPGETDAEPSQETVLFHWAMRPSFRNAGGKLERPDPWEVWDFVERKLDRIKFSDSRKTASPPSTPVRPSAMAPIVPSASLGGDDAAQPGELPRAALALGEGEEEDTGDAATREESVERPASLPDEEAGADDEGAPRFPAESDVTGILPEDVGSTFPEGYGPRDVNEPTTRNSELVSSAPPETFPLDVHEDPREESADPFSPPARPQPVHNPVHRPKVGIRVRDDGLETEKHGDEYLDEDFGHVQRVESEVIVDEAMRNNSSVASCEMQQADKEDTRAWEKPDESTESTEGQTRDTTLVDQPTSEKAEGAVLQTSTISMAHPSGSSGTKTPARMGTFGSVPEDREGIMKMAFSDDLISEEVLSKGANSHAGVSIAGDVLDQGPLSVPERGSDAGPARPESVAPVGQDDASSPVEMAPNSPDSSEKADKPDDSTSAVVEDTDIPSGGPRPESQEETNAENELPGQPILESEELQSEAHSPAEGRVDSSSLPSVSLTARRYSRAAAEERSVVDEGSEFFEAPSPRPASPSTEFSPALETGGTVGTVSTSQHADTTFRSVSPESSDQGKTKMRKIGADFAEVEGGLPGDDEDGIDSEGQQHSMLFSDGDNERFSDGLDTTGDASVGEESREVSTPRPQEFVRGMSAARVRDEYEDAPFDEVYEEYAPMSHLATEQSSADTGPDFGKSGSEGRGFDARLAPSPPLSAAADTSETGGRVSGVLSRDETEAEYSASVESEDIDEHDDKVGKNTLGQKLAGRFGSLKGSKHPKVAGAAERISVERSGGRLTRILSSSSKSSRKERVASPQKTDNNLPGPEVSKSWKREVDDVDRQPSATNVAPIEASESMQVPTDLPEKPVTETVPVAPFPPVSVHPVDSEQETETPQPPLGEGDGGVGTVTYPRPETDTETSAAVPPLVRGAEVSVTGDGTNIGRSEDAIELSKEARRSVPTARSFADKRAMFAGIPRSASEFRRAPNRGSLSPVSASSEAVERDTPRSGVVATSPADDGSTGKDPVVPSQSRPLKSLKISRMEESSGTTDNLSADEEVQGVTEAPSPFPAPPLGDAIVKTDLDPRESGESDAVGALRENDHYGDEATAKVSRMESLTRRLGGGRFISSRNRDTPRGKDSGTSNEASGAGDAERPALVRSNTFNKLKSKLGTSKPGRTADRSVSPSPTSAHQGNVRLSDVSSDSPIDGDDANLTRQATLTRRVRRLFGRRAGDDRGSATGDNSQTGAPLEHAPRRGLWAVFGRS